MGRGENEGLRREMEGEADVGREEGKRWWTMVGWSDTLLFDQLSRNSSLMVMVTHQSVMIPANISNPVK